MTDLRVARQLTPVYGFRYRPILKIWSDSSKHLVYKHEEGIATSYHWLRLAKRLPDGQWVLNTHSYSQQTNQHRSTLERFFQANGFHIGYRVEAPKGLQMLDMAQDYLRDERAKAWRDLDRPRIRKHTKQRFEERIDYLNDQIISVRRLIEVEQGRNEQATDGFNQGVVNL